MQKDAKRGKRGKKAKMGGVPRGGSPGRDPEGGDPRVYPQRGVGATKKRAKSMLKTCKKAGNTNGTQK